MSRRRTHHLSLALASDGSVLLNVSARLPPETLAHLAQALGVKPADLFIGTSLPPAQRAQALSRMDDAAAEAAARIQAGASAGTKRAQRRKRAPRS